MPDPADRATRRIKLVLQYDGAAFHGWQSQAGGGALQDALEGALRRLLSREIRAVAAGRTDRGVHALAMPVHIDLDVPIPTDRLAIGLTKLLPPAVGIVSSEEVAPDFDARTCARLRWYRYQILTTSPRRPLGPRAWHVHRDLDLEAMETGVSLLRGEHDFEGFRSSLCQASRTRLTMQEASMTRQGDLIALDFKCRSFLHHMVRFMAGTLVAMGMGRIDVAGLLRIRDQSDRPAMIYCAPPHGLCLMDVGYGPDECRAILEAHPSPPSF